MRENEVSRSFSVEEEVRGYSDYIRTDGWRESYTTRPSRPVLLWSTGALKHDLDLDTAYLRSLVEYGGALFNTPSIKGEDEDSQ